MERKKRNQEVENKIVAHCDVKQVDVLIVKDILGKKQKEKVVKQRVVGSSYSPL